MNKNQFVLVMAALPRPHKGPVEKKRCFAMDSRGISANSGWEHATEELAADWNSRRSTPANPASDEWLARTQRPAVARGTQNCSSPAPTLPGIRRELPAAVCRRRGLPCPRLRRARQSLVADPDTGSRHETPEPHQAPAAEGRQASPGW